MKLRFIVGLGGVSGVENKRSTHIAGDALDAVMVLIGVLVLYQWDVLAIGHLPLRANYVITSVIWGFILLKTIVMLSLVTNKLRYLSQNWMNLVILLVWLPLLFNPTMLPILYDIIRPITGLLLFIPWIGILRLSLMDGKLMTTLFSLVFAVVISGILITGVDPTFKNIGDGIWWAWVTMSTVGYGDYVPVSIGGRFLASAIILVGLCFFAILTANFSSIFIRRAAKREREIRMREEKQMESNFQEELMRRLDAIDESLRRLDPLHKSMKDEKPKHE